MSEGDPDYARPVTRITAEPDRNSLVPCVAEVHSSKGFANMSRYERRIDDGSFAERRLHFVLALVVATLIAAVSAYVLSGALLGPGYGPAHRTASVTWHAHS